MKSFTTNLVILALFLVLLPAGTYAFGAGDIPDFAYLNGKAFRHGDIESILSELAKTLGNAGGSGGLLDFAQSILGAATGGGRGSTFTKEDVKRVYFGNWLRDYSQAMDIAGLEKLSADTLVLIVSILGFLTFGFATSEFQVTPERLGVYLPVEHIDNPKGYAEKEGDARKFHPRLRPPVNPQELEIDPRNGMKNYMATEDRGWDTSTAHIRRVFRACIAYGRRAQGREGADLWETYRLMGTGLHTLEDLLAHSNWCELALRRMGYSDVFCHVGDSVLVNTPRGETHPLVTGTFGSADFLHSLMGEATDHLSQASVVDLSQQMENASQNNNSFGALQAIFKKLPIGGSATDDKMGEANSMQAQAQAYHFDPNNVAPTEVRARLWKLLEWRDGIYRDIIKKIEMIPGLSAIIDNLTNALNAFVYSVLAPYVSPILKQVTQVLTEGSKAVIDTEDQYRVFDDPYASDPSHSLLSKDHFALILNEPAGKIAQVVVQYSVKLLVESWFDDSNPDQIISEILEAFHHPWYATGRSRIEEEMFQALQDWVSGLENVEEVMQALTKESVRAGENKRQGSDADMTQSNEIYGGRVGPQTSGDGQFGVVEAAGYATSQGYMPSQGSYASGATGGYISSDMQRQGEAASYYGSSVPSYGGRYGETEAPQQREDTDYSYENRRQEEPTYRRETERGGYDDVPSYDRLQESKDEQGEEGTYGEPESFGGVYGASRRERGDELYGSHPSSERPRQRHEAEYGGRYSGAADYVEPRRGEGYSGGSYRREERSEYDRGSYGQEERPRYGNNEYGQEDRTPEYGRQQSGRYVERYTTPSDSGGYREGYAPTYGGGGNDEGYAMPSLPVGGGYPDVGAVGGYGSSDYRSEQERGYGVSASGGSHGEEQAYGREGQRGYGDGSDETLGVEGPSLGSPERRHHHSGKHHRHHQREEEY